MNSSTRSVRMPLVEIRCAPGCVPGCAGGSPIAGPPGAACWPIAVAVGGEEPEAFKTQSRDYAAHIGRTHDEIAGLDHMTMISALRSPRDSLGAVLAGWLAV